MSIMSITLPQYVMQDSIYVDEWHGDNRKAPSINIPLNLKPSPDKTLELAQIIATVVHRNTGYPYETIPESGSIELDHRVRVKPSGTVNHFIHLPIYLVNAARFSPDNVRGANGLVVVVTEKDYGQHFARSLESLTSILKGQVSHVNVL